MILGVDTSTKLTEQTAWEVKHAGYQFVGRYLVPPQKYTRKALTAKEAKIISDAGLGLLTVWETTAERASEGPNSGAADGATALKCARDIQMPSNGIIYFAVDFDANDGNMAEIRDYLRAARNNTEEYEIGVYGSYKVIEALRYDGICKGFWQCIAWSYGRKSTARNVYQCDAGKSIAGVSVDVNECDDMERAGIWTYKQGKEEESSVADKRYHTVNSMPSWARPTIIKLVSAKYLRGSGTKYDSNGYPADLNLSEDMIRMLVILDRAGAFDR